MATDLDLDDEISTVENTSNTSTGLVTNLIALLKAGFKSDTNPFGDAAKRDTWDGTGNRPTSVSGRVPQLNATGKVPGTMLDLGTTPDADKTTKGLVRAWDGTGTLPTSLGNDDVAAIINTDGKIGDGLLQAATTSQAGIVRQATTSEINSRTDVDAYVPPDALGGGGAPDGFFVRKGASIDNSGTGILIPMTNEIRDAKNIYSLSSGQVSVPRGEYWIEARGFFDGGGGNEVIYIRAGSLNSEQFEGKHYFSDNADTYGPASCCGYFNLSSSTSVSFRMSNLHFKGYGRGTTAVSAWIKIWKL